MLNESQLKQIEAVREKIRKTMPTVLCESCYLHKPGTYTRKDCVTYEKRECALEKVYIDQILSLPELAILDKDQSTPEPIYDDSYRYAQKDMLSAHFQRTIDKEDIK